MELRKLEVCPECLMHQRPPFECICTYMSYKPIILELNVCNCCGNIVDDGNPPETVFNIEQLKNLTQ